MRTAVTESSHFGPETSVFHVAGSEPDSPAPTRLLIARRRGRQRIILVEQIIWIEAEGNYVRVHTADGAYLVRAALHQLDRSLQGQGFLRVHRSALVPAREMYELVVGPTGGAALLLRSGPRVPVSRHFRRRLAEVALNLEKAPLRRPLRAVGMR